MKNCNITGYSGTWALRRIACVGFFGMAVACALPAAAQAQTITPPSVPPGLEVPEGNEAFRVGHAFGTQNYICLPVDSIGHVAFTLFTPEATLLGEQDEQLTTHFFSPNPDEGGVVRATWEDSVDTSFVWARAVAQATVDPKAITWVKLETAGTDVGPTGGDTLAKTTFVQRVNTRGGLAPATGCSLPTDIGSKRFVPYKADYFFYKQN
jgi:hypothetical protein